MNSDNVITFPRGNRRATGGFRELKSLDDFVPADAALDARVAELLPLAHWTMGVHPPEAIAQLLAYSAARLERVGFKVFRP